MVVLSLLCDPFGLSGILLTLSILSYGQMAISKKAGAKKAGGKAAPSTSNSKSNGSSSKGGVAKADWREGFKKPQAGVSDMTLLSKVSNEAVNENLQKRFQNKEIYVSSRAKKVRCQMAVHTEVEVERAKDRAER